MEFQVGDIVASVTTGREFRVTHNTVIDSPLVQLIVQVQQGSTIVWVKTQATKDQLVRKENE